MVMAMAEQAVGVASEDAPSPMDPPDSPPPPQKAPGSPGRMVGSDAEEGGAATAMKEETRPAPPKLDRMPPWQVLLHNDDVNDMVHVVETIMSLTPLRRNDAVQRMLEAHTRGLSLLLNTHREHAELLQEQFQSKRLTVTIEPA